MYKAFSLSSYFKTRLDDIEDVKAFMIRQIECIYNDTEYIKHKGIIKQFTTLDECNSYEHDIQYIFEFEEESIC